MGLGKEDLEKNTSRTLDANAAAAAIQMARKNNSYAGRKGRESEQTPWRSQRGKSTQLRGKFSYFVSLFRKIPLQPIGLLQQFQQANRRRKSGTRRRKPAGKLGISIFTSPNIFTKRETHIAGTPRPMAEYPGYLKAACCVQNSDPKCECGLPDPSWFQSSEAQNGH